MLPYFSVFFLHIVIVTARRCTIASDCGDHAQCITFTSNKGICFCSHQYSMVNGICAKRIRSNVNGLARQAEKGVISNNRKPNFNKGVPTDGPIIEDSNISKMGFGTPTLADDLGSFTTLMLQATQLPFGSGAQSSTGSPIGRTKTYDKQSRTYCPELNAKRTYQKVCFQHSECVQAFPYTQYCLCQPGWAGKHCSNYVGQVDGGRHGSTRHRTQSLYYKDKMFVYKTQTDAATLARYYAESVDHCVEICVTYGDGCRSVNVGPALSASRMICQLLIERADATSQLNSWLVGQKNWTYACCFNS